MGSQDVAVIYLESVKPVEEQIWHLVARTVTYPDFLLLGQVPLHSSRPRLIQSVQVLEIANSTIVHFLEFGLGISKLIAGLSRLGISN